MNRTKPRYSAKNSVVAVDFYCHAPHAKRVCLVGDFNKWFPAANPMTHNHDGTWTIRINLHAGHHQYLFLVDGKPVLDPKAHGVGRNERGDKVSLKAIS